ncbi:YibE/F family protein [Wukongibacter baidiensis]|uniref:YibE/F family protein n=1 Tax=Wukongibacter baidiensis TaxID=1723361 RepID=UPI003D7F85D0
MGRRIVLLILIFLFLGSGAYAEENNGDILKAEVLKIEEYSRSGVTTKSVKVKILEGEYKGKGINIEYIPVEYSSNSYELRKGSRVLIKLSTGQNGRIKGNIINVSREDHLKLLGIIFLVVIIIFGGIKGILSVTSLGISGLVIVKIMIPLIVDGHNPMMVAIISTIIIILISFILISGFTRKSLVAIIGTVGGTIIAGILAKVFTDLCSITGLASEEVNFLITYMNTVIDYRGLYLSGVLIGAIGVVMDVSMSITSVIFELKDQNPNMTFAGLIASGLKVGRDIMATMVNTLILAYVGGAMPILLVFHFMKMPLGRLVSMEILSTEIIRSLCGSIGLVSTIPLTSLVASMMAPNIRSRKRMYNYRR